MPAEREGRSRVAILGGGMAGLAAAWALSDPRDPERREVTVYQRGWRLGGKGASSRGADGRIEEHGLHVWLGYYDNAFRLIREVYGELDRPRTDPDCPIATWRDAFEPADRVGVADRAGGDWSHWVATFARNRREPGDDDAAGGPLSTATFVRRGLALLVDFSESISRGEVPSPPAGVVLSASPAPPGAVPQVTAVLRQAEIAAMVGAVESIRMLRAVLPGALPLVSFVVDALERLRADLVERLRAADDGRRAQDLADLVITCLQGTMRDGLLADPSGFAAIDHLDFREWLAGHGARPQTLDSPLIRGMYDLVFAYEDGDAARPRFSAGLGLFLSGKLFFDYKGSIFWRMRAGMGDVVFAPLYQALRARGVRFAFLHRVDALKVEPGERRVASVVLGRQARLAPGVEEYEPLERVRELPCFPSTPRPGQLAAAVGEDLEAQWAGREAEEQVVLRAGVDFDEVVLATSLGMVPYVCGELLAESPRWRAMVDGVATVATQSFQAWMGASERALGAPHAGATVSGYVTPFDTYASMTHLLEREDWDGDDAPRAIAYFCSALADDAATDPAAADAAVRAGAAEHLERYARDFWPGALDADGSFRWELVRAQYSRANIDPSDRYVQSLPGSGARRLRADASGYENLFLAGDWVDCGLNAGCIEAAAMAGVQAANAVRGRPLMEGVLGTWYGLGDDR